jgi:hypothetical protein
VLPLPLLVQRVLLAVLLRAALLRRSPLSPYARWARWVSPRSLQGRSVLPLVQRLALPVQRTLCSLRRLFRRLVVLAVVLPL